MRDSHSVHDKGCGLSAVLHIGNSDSWDFES